MVNIDPYLAIIENGTDGDSVRDAIINAINEINKESTYKVQARNISGKVSELPTTIKAPAGVVYKQINLDIQNDDGSGESTNVSENDFEVNNSTENKTYTAKELWGENTRIGSVTVNIDLSSSWQDIEDNVQITTLDLDNTSTWHASTMGYSAVRSITFTNVDAVSAKGGTIGPGGSTYFKVRFINDETGQQIGATQSVIEGGSAVQPDASLLPVKPGYTIGGWDPPITNITKSIDPHPVWVQPQYGGESTTLANVLKDRGASANLGDWFSYTVNNVQIPYEACAACGYNVGGHSGTFSYSITMGFFKAAVGEAGSTSTWLSFPCRRITGTSSYEEDICPFSSPSNEISWEVCAFRKFLNQIIYGYVFGQELKNAIVQVPKYTGVWRAGNIQVNTTQDKLWIPSLKEISMPIDNIESNESWAPYISKPAQAIRYYQLMGFTSLDDRYNFMANQIGDITWLKAMRDDSGGLSAWYSPYWNLKSNNHELSYGNGNRGFKSNIFGFCL